MVNRNRELDLHHLAINETNLQNFLEEYNPSYKTLRETYNQLVKNKVNPLINQGLSTDKLSFIILLLENILRTTDLISDQNRHLFEKITILEQKVTNISENELTPIIQAGNKITEELKLFKTGFQDWHKQFEKFEGIFDTWDTGFQTLETKFNNLETILNNWNEGFKTFEKNFDKFENNFSKLENFLDTFTNTWNRKIARNETSLKRIETNITVWSNGIDSINLNLRNIEQQLATKQPSIINVPSTSTHKTIFRKQKDLNHQFTF